jgi:tripartite-type tricarboxylate transporter receptor subunit TctC
VSGVDADSYWGIYAPAGTPPEVLNTLSEHFARALRNPAVVERIRGLGYRVIANSPQEHTRMMREAIARWTEVIEKAKITVE